MKKRIPKSLFNLEIFIKTHHVQQIPNFILPDNKIPILLLYTRIEAKIERSKN